ncbi:LLM class flavin-dependent oxidoreductase [Microlunatus elymi]|uniref:LLM class flavin-dependent oxidoreductase n=1 Tax=Microlunatus elymi TaxID=2596828 RepID=A0A516PYA7_9ACTN|nr:LLM class flavin-dependent oxidoreductase [Microlunatus elymi]QDP96142.1 LLM class flavin-dependent oxidoreductase [Microlunatus elymi]
MPDYGRELSFGTFITPANADPQHAVELAQLSERLGLELVTFQDHPYQPAFLDTWTLISYVAARTERISLSANVTNLPLRPPAVLARSVASLDLLSDGRIELGLGAGAFWDAIEAMGATRLTPGESIEALEEAIIILRALWDADQRGGVRVDGKHYRVHGAKRGPAPAHPVGIWIGAYKPRMLRLTGRLADGWLPSEGYLQPGDLARANKIIDEAAVKAGRRPADIRRLLNLSGLEIDHLVELAVVDGIDTFIVPADDAAAVHQVAAVAEEVRDRVARAREKSSHHGPGDHHANQIPEHQLDKGPEPVEAPEPHRSEPELTDRSEYDRLGVHPTPDDGARLLPRQPWDEAGRPHRRPSGPEVEYTARGRAVGKHLIDVHDHLREELTVVRDIVEQVRTGAVQAAAARSTINDLTMRQNDWTLGAYCASYCRLVAGHHGLEDESIFPHLRQSDRDLGEILDRLIDEHQVIHEVLEEIDRRLVGVIEDPGHYEPLQEAVDLLSDTLLSHLSYEEQELVEPLARFGFYAHQV